ncbi:type II toxin-antitoxin system ParD family antitoxin [Rhizobium sp. AQ_MP]|uniref:ribbon-helix-helix domain-containing protein n=1 Tax=Rhizobium sp. AQ_MP TaxID=2761536 RepID=UPI00163ABC72|nr:type II toxin-antitoxin system ParD family antitoxin [Rhizobium sp. AQ_MP]MBC2774545.1 type II toxin-antitoxin system ParD family antitoxin [Rhizobium sp. AQ_MP]
MQRIQLSARDAEFVAEKLSSGLYETVDAVVAAGLELLRERDDAELRQFIQEGLDDVEAGRVHTYENAEDLLADIKRGLIDAHQP